METVSENLYVLIEDGALSNDDVLASIELNTTNSTSIRHRQTALFCEIVYQQNVTSFVGRLVTPDAPVGENSKSKSRRRLVHYLTFDMSLETLN